MNNKKVKQMMVDVAKHISVSNGNPLCDDKMWISWIDGPCLSTAGANFIWLHTGIVSIKAEQLKGKS